MGSITDVTSLGNFTGIPEWTYFDSNKIDKTEQNIDAMVSKLDEKISNTSSAEDMQKVTTLKQKLKELLPTTQVSSTATTNNATPVDVNVQVSKSGEKICVGLTKEAKDKINAMTGGKRSRSKNAKSKSKSTQKKNKKGSKRQGKYKKNGGRSNKNNQ